MPTLQEQINTAISGATITLPDGSEHVGNFVIDKSLTLQGKAKIVTPNAGPAIFIPPKTQNVTLRGLEITASGSMVYAIVQIGTWQTTVLEEVPRNITFEECNIHGHEKLEAQQGIRADGANVSVIRCRIWEIHNTGFDCQAFFAGNGPGPFKIIDSYLEASGENVLFGGSDARVLNLVPSDIEIRRCYLFKPLTWRVGDPSYKGIHWKCKNILELKMARRVVIDGNKLENCWGDAQIGFGVLFTTRNQDGGNPWATVEDVEFTNNELLNVAGGFQLIGKDYPNVSAQGARVRIANNVIRMAQKSALGPNGRLLQMERTKDVTFENNDANPDHTFIVFAGDDAQPGLIYRRNVLTTGEYGITPAGLPPKDALTKYAPGHDFSENILIAASDLSRLYPAGNTFVTSRPAVIPVGIGVDMEALKAAQGGTVTAPVTEPAPSPEPSPAPSPTPEPEPAPSQPSAENTRVPPSSQIVDSQGGVWTLNGTTILRNGQGTGGFGSLIIWCGGRIYALGTDNGYWAWASGTHWDRAASEPCATAPQPAPAPTEPAPIEPAPSQSPAPTPPRIVVWPSSESGQTALWQNQAKEGYRPNKHVPRPANMPKGQYVEFVKF